MGALHLYTCQHLGILGTHMPDGRRYMQSTNWHEASAADAFKWKLEDETASFAGVPECKFKCHVALRNDFRH